MLFFAGCLEAPYLLTARVFSIYVPHFQGNRPFPSSPEPLYQNEVKCLAFDMEIIFHSHENETHFHKKGGALGLVLKARVFATRKWPIEKSSFSQNSMPSTSSSSCSALFNIIDGTTQSRWRAWRSSSENRCCIWMIKESRRGIGTVFL